MYTRSSSVRYLVFTLLLITAVAVLDGGEKFRNERVAVYQDTLAPGQEQSLSGDRPAVTVYLEGANLEVTPAAGRAYKLTVKPGEIIFKAIEPQQLRNIGNSEAHSVRIEFLLPGTQEDWGSNGLSPHYKVLLDNQYARVYDIRIPAGTSEPQHTHRDRVVICLSGAELKHRFPDGRTEVSSLKTGEIAWRRGSTHIGQNLGNTDFHAVAVEPK